MAKAKTHQEPQEGQEAEMMENTVSGEEKAKGGKTGEEIRAYNGPVYTAKEFAAAAGNVFGGKYSPDIILTAFRLAGVKEATVPEAEGIVSKFAEQEVN